MSKAGLTNCCLYLMYVFTFLFWLCGCAVLGVGLYLRFNADTREIFSAMAPYHESDTETSDVDAIGTKFFLYYCYALMCLGGIIMFVGFIGCCGTIYESTCILCFFSFLLLILMFVEIGGGGYGYYEVQMRGQDSEQSCATQRESNTEPGNRLYCWVSRDIRHLVFDRDNPTSKAAVDTVQQRLKCCGAAGPSDHPENTKPESCTDQFGAGYTGGVQQFYQAGCNEKMTKFMREHVLAGLVVVFCVGVFQFFGIICSMCLCCGIRRYDDYSNV